MHTYIYIFVYSLFIRVMRPCRRKYNKFFFHLNNKNSLVLMKHEDLVFKLFGGGLHKRSHFNSWTSTLGLTWNCFGLQKAKKFPRNPGQFEWFIKEARYHWSIAIRNLKSQVVELVQRPTIMLEILYFSSANQYFQISLRIKSF